MEADFSNALRIQSAVRRASEHLRPPPDLKPSEWAEDNIRIPIGNAIPGLIRFDNAPYQREPLDMTAHPGCHRITLMWSAQVGKTTVALCGQAFRIGQNPTSQIMMQPSEGDLRTWLETKFNPMVEANPRLQELIAKPRSREGVNNAQMKSYPGGFMMFAWSGSPKTMRGRSAPFLVCDETDGYDRVSEGHPVSILSQRAATYGDDQLVLEISTPTHKDLSWIEPSYESGDQRQFYVACPHCGEFQTLRWSGVSWEKDDDGNHLPETAGYVCINGCSPPWNDGQRIAAIRTAEQSGGGWRAEKPFRGHASYHLNELYSTLRRLPDIVQSFLDKKAAGDLQTFTNVSLAETWEESGEKADPTGLMGRAEDYPADVPQGACWLSAGVDMQEDRLEMEVVGWAVGEESWSVDYQVLWGDPLQGDVWSELDDAIATTYTHESGATLSINAVCIDTGGRAGYPQAAYEYCKTRIGKRIFAIKGVPGWGRPIVTAPSKKRHGRGQRPVHLFSVGVDEAKVIVFRRFLLEEPGPGYCHFPDTRDPEWFRQITAEKLTTRYSKGYPIREWHKLRNRNEGFDCRVYAYAALKIATPNLKRAAQRLTESEEDTGGAKEKTENPPEDAQPPRRKNGTSKKPRRRRRTGWVNNW